MTILYMYIHSCCSSCKEYNPKLSGVFTPSTLRSKDEKVAKGFAEGCGGKSTLITVESKTASDISQAQGFL